MKTLSDLQRKGRCLEHRLPRVGILGLGRQGAEHLQACVRLAKQNKLVVGGICDVNPQRRRDLADATGVPTFADDQTMYRESRLDAVIVAVPNNLHAESTRIALENGLHVLKEKPFALSLSDGWSLASLASRNGLKLSVAQQRQFHPHYLTARRWTQQIGRIRFVDYSFCLNDTTDSWYWNKGHGGGCWHGLGWHGCWMFNFLGAHASQVCLQQLAGRRRATVLETDDTCFLTSLNSDGTLGRMFLSVVHPEKKEEVFIDADGGSVRLNRKGVELFDELGAQIASDFSQHSWAAAYEAQISSFLQRIDSPDTGIELFAWDTMLLHSVALVSAEAGGTLMPVAHKATIPFSSAIL